MNQPASLKSSVPSRFSVKSITWVPCEYQRHEDPVLARDLVHHVGRADRGLRLRAHLRAVDRLRARPRCAAYGFQASGTVVGIVGLELRDVVRVHAAVALGVVRARQAGRARRRDAAAALVGGEQVAARRGELGLVVEVDVLGRRVRGSDRSRCGPGGGRCRGSARPRATARRREPVRDVQVLGALTGAVHAVGDQRAGLERRVRHAPAHPCTGSGVPRGLSSSGVFVPRLSNAPLMSNMISAPPLPQVSRSFA